MIKKLLKYLPYVLAACLFFAGRLTAPQPDKELIQKYELERKTLEILIQEKEAKIIDLSNAGLTIRKKMYEDSLKYSVSLKANNAAYLKLKKKYNEINLSRANSHTLDYIVLKLFPD